MTTQISEYQRSSFSANTINNQPITHEKISERKLNGTVTLNLLVFLSASIATAQPYLVA